MKELQTIGFQGNNVRVFYRDGSPWWALTDVCKVLGIQNPSQAAQRISEKQKGIYQAYTPGGVQNIIIINESGLYSIVFKSDKPEARRFTDWVTEKVLPMIRTYGYYIMPGEYSELGNAKHDLYENEFVRLFSYTKTPIRKEVSEMHPNGVDVVRFDLVYADNKNYCIFDIKTGIFTGATFVDTLVKGYQETIIKRGGKRKCSLVFVGPGKNTDGFRALKAAQKAKHISFGYMTYEDLYKKACEKIEKDHKDRIGYMPKPVLDLISPVNFPYISGTKKMPELTAV